MENQTLVETQAGNEMLAAGDEFQLEMVDLGAAYQNTSADVAACFRCYCGSGCLCGCVSPSLPTNPTTPSTD